MQAIAGYSSIQVILITYGNLIPGYLQNRQNFQLAVERLAAGISVRMALEYMLHLTLIQRSVLERPGPLAYAPGAVWST